MTPDELAAIKEREAKAVPGPWSFRRIESSEYIIEGFDSEEYLAMVMPERELATFIANARTDIPALIAEVERLQAHVDATRQMLRIECAEYTRYGANDWPDNLHLADVVEKYLARSAQQAIRDAEGEAKRLREALKDSEQARLATEQKLAEAVRVIDRIVQGVGREKIDDLLADFFREGK
jgi:hypothetical protein